MAEITNWRAKNPHKPLFGQKADPVPATRFFDQLSFIGNPNVGCFVLETIDGIILLDCMEPKEEFKQMIIDGFSQLGLDLNDLKMILVTHGHGDHYGTANWFRDQYGCRIYMSKGDYEYAKQDECSPTGVLTWDIYDFIDDGDVIELGGQKVYCFMTSGHTPYCMSFIIPVTDNGEPHMMAMWGGSGIPYNPSEKVKYLKSCLRFAKITEKFGVDGEIASHPFIDKGTERLAVVRDIPDGVPNPFVLGKEGYKKMEEMYLGLCIDAMEKQAEVLDKVVPEDPRIARMRERKAAQK